MLEVGQWAIATPARPRRAISASSNQMPCASQTSSASQPQSSSRSTGRIP
jgi:hypothetical protein